MPTQPTQALLQSGSVTVMRPITVASLALVFTALPGWLAWLAWLAWQWGLAPQQPWWPG